MSDLDWGQSLANVRTAYRVVAAYQQRVQAMMKIAGREFEPLEFANWFPGHINMPPKRASDPKSPRTWDFLPLHCAVVILNEQGNRRWDIQTGECMIVCMFCADSAFLDTAKDTPKQYPDPSRLPSSFETKTILRIYAFKWLSEPANVDYWNDFWAVEQPDGAIPSPAERTSGKWQVMFVEADLANLETEEAFTTHVRTFRDSVNTAFRLDKPLGAA